MADENASSTRTADHDQRPPLSFARMDIEKRLGFPAGRFTQPGPVLPLVLAALLSVGFCAALVPFADTWIARSFTERWWVPYATVAFSAWAVMIIFIKSRKIALQRRALRHRVVPSDPEFVLDAGTVNRVLERLFEIADEPRHFLLYKRIQFALSNLRNVGRIGDVDEMLQSRAQNDEAAVDSSYTVVRGLIWAIPVLGFIGTVIGLSEAIGAFGHVLSEATDIGQLRPALQSVTAGLATAFETTLQALVAALVIQMLMTFIRRNEEGMLDDFIAYCDQQVVGRLRLRGADDTERESDAT